MWFPHPACCWGNVLSELAWGERVWRIFSLSFTLIPLQCLLSLVQIKPAVSQRDSWLNLASWIHQVWGHIRAGRSAWVYFRRAHRSTNLPTTVPCIFRTMFPCFPTPTYSPYSFPVSTCAFIDEGSPVVISLLPPSLWLLQLSTACPVVRRV